MSADDTAHHVHHTHRRISWSAILGGVVMVIAIQMVLSILGAGIGLGTVNTNAGSTPNASTLGMGAAIWWFVSSSLALFVGGYVSAWLAGVEIDFDGWLHGLITWSLATIVTMYLLTTAVGSVLGGGFSALSSMTSAAGSTVSEVAKPLAQAAGLTPEALQQQVQGYLQPINPDPATMSPQDAQKEIAMNLVKYANGGPEADTAKTRIITVMAVQRKISQQEATAQFDAAQAQLKATKDRTIQQAKDTADASAAAVSRTSMAAFFVFLLGALFAGYGGSMGVQPHFHHFNRFMARPQA